MNEDVSPIKNGDFPASHISFGGSKSMAKKGTYILKGFAKNVRLPLISLIYP